MKNEKKGSASAKIIYFSLFQQQIPMTLPFSHIFGIYEDLKFIGFNFFHTEFLHFWKFHISLDSAPFLHNFVHLLLTVAYIVVRMNVSPSFEFL